MKPTIRLLLLLLAWTALGRTVAWGQVCATPGKDGSPGSLTGVVNTYFPGSGTASSGTRSISVATAAGATGTGITPGDLLLVIQMQGADINGTDDTAYGANNGSGTGNLATNFTAGTYEYIVANSSLATGAAGTITTVTNLVNTYSTVAATATAARRSFQVVRIPQYANVTLGGQVNAAAWNGSTGGVLAMDVAGTLTLAGQTLNAAGLGFRGGAGIRYTGYAAAGGTNASYRTLVLDATATGGVNGSKGEGTAGTPRYTAIGIATRVDNTTLANAFASGVTSGYPNGDNGRGAPGNAGGGATDGQAPTANGFNAGGAGGGNGAGGGFGGSPRDGSAIANTTVRALGGASFAASASRLVMGGGGGAGTNNDGNGEASGLSSSGAPGGGIILVRVGSLSGTGTANASGTGGYSLLGLTNNDGTGGGGAGGTVLVTAKNATSLNTLTVLATGGAGSSNINGADVPHGPGGGGSGGIVFANGALAAATVTGGAAGTTTYSTGVLATGTIPFGATAGADGTRTTNISSAIANSAAGADCVADLSSTITAQPSANVGQNVSVQVTFSNAGPAAAPATGTVTVPTGNTVLSATGGSISVAGNGVTTITYAIASLAVSGSSPFTITYRPTAAGTVMVNSSVGSTTLDLVTANNTGSANTTISSTGAAGTPALCANPGKDGNTTLSTTATPNTYYPSNGAQSLAVGATTINLGAATGATTPIAIGDLLLVIQMQGATIDITNSTTYGTVNATGYTAGQYEYVVAANSVPVGGGNLTLGTGLKNAYVSAVATTTAGQRSFQVVRVPQYANLTLSSDLSATPWNGSSGGIIALDVANQTNLGGRTISASGAGFRGGAGRRLRGVNPTTGYSTTDYRSTAGTGGATSSGGTLGTPAVSVAGLNGTKGEGTAGTPRYVSTGTALLDTRAGTVVNGLPAALTDGYPNGDNGRGAPGTAGGGGTDGELSGNEENSGGGGGANGGSGGRGGNTWRGNAATGGEPGMAFGPASTSRLVLGGGGGAGSTNNGSNDASLNGFNSSGAAGGGIVILRTGSLSGTGTIVANGANAISAGTSNSNLVQSDGSGGGGAGGSILVTAAVPATISSLTLSAAGGIGGSNTLDANTTAHGPGGGGGGGVILTNGAAASTPSVALGANGLTYPNASTTGMAYGSASGVAGITNTQISTRIANSVAGANCAADVTVSLAGPTTLNAGQPTGNFTATFTNQGPSIATNVMRLITLPAGASLTPDQTAVITRAYPGTTFPTASSIRFTNLASLASDASNVVSFAFTAPTTTGSSALTGNTGPDTNGSSEGINFAPNQSSLTLNTVTTADVRAALMASATATTGRFDVTFSNIGAQTAAGVVRTVQLPTGLTGVTVSGGNDAGSYNATTGLVTYTTSPTTIAGAGGTLTSTISYPLTSSLTPVAATATVSTTTNEAGLRDNNTATAVVPATFDLTTTLTGPTTTIAGSPTVLYVTTSNNGPNAAPVAAQTVTIPSATALTNVYLTNGGTYVYNTTDKAGIVTFPNVANLPSGASVTNSISFTVPVNDGSPTTSTAPSATVAVSTGETKSSDNTAYLNGGPLGTTLAVLGNTTATNNTYSKSNEQVTIVASAAIVDANSVVTYSVTAKDAGASGATSVSNVATKVQLLPGLTASTLTVGTNPTVNTVNGNIQYTTSNGISTYNPITGVLTYYNVASQTSGTTIAYDALAVTVPANVGNDGQLLVTASVSTDDIDPIPADNTSSVAVKVKTTADLTATITGPTTATAGQKVSYTATFTNLGLGTASSVVETVQLPIGLSNVNVVVQDASGNVITNAYSAITGLVTLPTILSDASGASQVYGISFVAPGQPFVVSSRISSGTIDNVVTNNASAVTTTVSPTADVAIYLNGPPTAVAGNAVTYAVTATNNGPNVASSVTPSLQLPSNLSGVTVTNGGSYNAANGLVTFATTNLVSGDSRVGLVTFTMPSSPANGLVVGGATYAFGGTTPSVDVVVGNNTAGIITTIAPATTELADLVTSITPPPTPTVAGSSVSYGVSFTNQSTTTAAIKVMPVAYLPAGLTGVSVTNAAGDVIPGAGYNSTTGQVTFPTIDTQAAGNTTSYIIKLTAPANDVVLSASSVSSNTSDPDPSNNYFSNTLPITPSFDVTTKLAGPTSATPGSTNTYTVTTTNNGPSTSPTEASTTQTVTVPVGSIVTGLPTGATYANGVITFATVNGQPTGANGAVSNTFTVRMPATGSLAISAAVTLAGESNVDNNQDNLSTAPFNPAPVAQNVWNTVRSARGNTSNLGGAPGLPISNLQATDDVAVTGFTIVNVPDPTQGFLYYNGVRLFSGNTIGTASGLSFVPTSGYVGNATFTYTATDGNSASNIALYTIPVAQDIVAQYTNYNNSQPGNTYTTGMVLAQIVDPNAAVYSSTGAIYDANGVLQSGAANGLPTTGINATLTSGTLPAGVSLDPATGRIYISGPLANSPTPQTYNLSVTTVDSNGGMTVVPVSFTIGANPLPVTLVAFTAQAVANRDALLTWSTATETRNDYFEVERSFDGTAFSPVAKIAGKGTTTVASTYTLSDANVAARATGTVYYRLRQVDLDGTATYSPQRTVSFTKATTVSLGLFPNPVATGTTLDLSQLSATGTYQVQLLDATGRLVRSWQLAGGQPQPLDLHAVASGSYLLVVAGTQPDGSPLRQALRLTKE